jgi:hypothetical protein
MTNRANFHKLIAAIVRSVRYYVDEPTVYSHQNMLRAGPEHSEASTPVDSHLNRQPLLFYRLIHAEAHAAVAVLETSRAIGAH